MVKLFKANKGSKGLAKKKNLVAIPDRCYKFQGGDKNCGYEIFKRVKKSI